MFNFSKHLNLSLAEQFFYKWNINAITTKEDFFKELKSATVNACFGDVRCLNLSPHNVVAIRFNKDNVNLIPVAYDHEISELKTDIFCKEEWRLYNNDKLKKDEVECFIKDWNVGALPEDVISFIDDYLQKRESDCFSPWPNEVALEYGFEADDHFMEHFVIVITVNYDHPFSPMNEIILYPVVYGKTAWGHGTLVYQEEN